MGLAFVVLACLLAGGAVAGRLYRDAPRGDAGADALERACAGLLLALAMGVSTSWVLAFAGLLRTPWLVAAFVPFFLYGARQAFRALRRNPELRAGNVSLPELAALVVVVLWIAIVLWRGTLVPPYNHDALAYHMPRAAMMVQQGRWTVPDVHEARMASWPCDYELLLADTMVLWGSDQLTGWIGTASYVAFLLFGAALVSRWWGWGRHAILVAVVSASTPIAILHSGLHKNDLMMSAFALAIALWGAEWALRGSVRALGLTALTLFLTLGSKPTGAFVWFAALPMLAMGAYRTRAWLRAHWVTALGIGAGACLVGLGLLGGFVYVVNLVRFHRPVLPPDTPGYGYGAWGQVWLFLYMALATPFYGPNETWAPWDGAYWWLPHNDVWFSTYGVIFTLMVVALPFCAHRYKGQGSARGRWLAGGYALAVVLLMLPLRVLPFGMVMGSTRYFMFMVPIAAGCTLSPVLLELERRAIYPAVVAWGASLGTAALFASHALTYGLNDAYVPIEWLKYLLAHPADRRPFIRRNRAAYALDAAAGPNDHVAFDVAFDAWIYPAYGAGWTRHVTFLPQAAGEVPIPDDVDWVVIDRTWNVFFGNPGFTDFGKYGLLGRGEPSADDLKVYRQLRADARFALVYRDKEQNQALFRRKPDDQKP